MRRVPRYNALPGRIRLACEPLLLAVAQEIFEIHRKKLSFAGEVPGNQPARGNPFLDRPHRDVEYLSDVSIPVGALEAQSFDSEDFL